MNMRGHISNTLSNHPTPFEDTNYNYTIYGVLSKIEKNAVRRIRSRGHKKKRKERSLVCYL